MEADHAESSAGRQPVHGGKEHFPLRLGSVSLRAQALDILARGGKLLPLCAQPRRALTSLRNGGVGPAQLPGIGIELRRELLNAGYPEAALRDLSDEDIALCEGFAAVSSDTETQELDKQQGGGKLTFTTVAVKLDRDGEHWRIFTHFEWSGADFRGTELIRIIPGYMRDGARLGWGPDGEITGRLLYDTDGKTVTAPYYSLIDSHSSYTDPFFGMTESLGILGSFSMPSQSEHQRGYVAYGTAIPASALDYSTEEYDGFALTSVAGFTHQYNIWQFPVKTAESVVRSGSISFSECFANLWSIFSETN